MSKARIARRYYDFKWHRINHVGNYLASYIDLMRDAIDTNSMLSVSMQSYAITGLNTDSYDLVGDKGVVATTDFDVQNVFSVPLGVTLSKGFVAGGWTLAPSADLTVTFNTGDTEAKSTTTFTGAPAIGLNTEVLDEVQYGVTLGLGAQNGAFGTSFGINYTGSSNTDSFGVNAQCRYMF